MAGLWYLVERTRTGKAMRAVAEDKEIAALMGINVNRTIVTTFAVGGAMAGVAGILWGLLFRSVIATTGFLPGIKAFTAAVVGGVGNLGGAMAGGVSLGTAEALAPLMLLEPLGVDGVSQLRDAVAFTLLILVLLVKPTGPLRRATFVGGPGMSATLAAPATTKGAFDINWDKALKSGGILALGLVFICLCGMPVGLNDRELIRSRALVGLPRAVVPPGPHGLETSQRRSCSRAWRPPNAACTTLWTASWSAQSVAWASAS